MERSARRRLGPYSLDEILAVTASILRDPDHEEDFIEAAMGVIAEREDRVRRRQARSARGGDGFGSRPTWNEYILARPAGVDVAAIAGPEGTADYYAQYKPFEKGKTDAGIYFVRGSLKRTVGGRPDIPLRSFLSAIAVHEIFHYYVDRLALPRPDPGTFGHGCALPCEIEEAGADFMARESAKTDLRALSSFDDLLFRPRDRGGLPGYGDYNLLDERIASLIPYLKGGAGRPCTRPVDYRTEAEKVLRSPSFAGYLGAPLWELALSNARAGQLSFYLDLAA